MPVPILLIHAADTLIGALLGALLEDTTAQIVFAERGESMEDAARRLRARIVVAEVTTLPSGRTALTENAILVGFGSSEDCARARVSGFECFELPRQGEQLRRHVESLVEAAV